MFICYERQAVLFEKSVKEGLAVEVWVCLCAMYIESPVNFRIFYVFCIPPPPPRF